MYFGKASSMPFTSQQHIQLLCISFITAMLFSYTLITDVLLAGNHYEFHVSM